MDINPKCARCLTPYEDLSHALFHCPHSKNVWKLANFWGAIKSLADCQTRDVLLGIFWSLDKAGFERFVVILWSIWFERNQVLHGQNCRDPSLVLESATQTVFDYQRVGRVDDGMHTTPSPRR